MSTTLETMSQMWAKAQENRFAGLPVELRKAITQSTGLVWYDLEPYAKLLFPVITPLRNEIPRVAGDGGTATHWKSITAINSTNVSIGVGEGQRGGTITTVEQDNVATYKTIGLDDSVTWQADLAAKNFDDVKRLAVDNLLRSVMIGEEIAILGANSSTGLGATPTPTLSQATTGGAMSDGTYSVICVAMCLDGYRSASVVGGIPGQITRTNTDGSVISYGGGSGKQSTAASIVVNGGGATEVVKATVADVPGSVAYAWFWGAVGSEKLGAITTINSYVITTNTATGTQTAASLGTGDNSTNPYLFDGLIPIVSGLANTASSGSGSYYKAQATGVAGVGTPLTADGAGGIVEIDAAFKSFWDNYKLAPQAMLVNSQELMNITNKVIAGGAAPLFRFVMDNQNQSNAGSMALTAGAVVGTYLNKYTMAGGQLCQVLLHPNVPPGTIIFYSRKLPYPLSNVSNLLQMKMRRDYFQIEWPQVKPAYEFSVWCDGVMQVFFPPAFGVIKNIANG